MYISFDIGGTTIKYGVVNNHGEIVFQDKIKTEDNKENFFHNMKELIVALRQRLTYWELAYLPLVLFEKMG